MQKGKITSAGNTEVLQDLLNNAPLKGASTQINTPAESLKAGSSNKTKEQKILVNFKLNVSTKEKLQEYCDRNDMTLTAGIKKAIQEMIKNESIL